MSILTGTIQGTGQTVNIDVPTSRIPELPAVILPYEDTDKIAFFDDSENKTVYAPMLTLRQYIIAGNSAGATPILAGSDYEITITAAMAGTRRVIVPALAGKSYTIKRRGVGELKTNEWVNLASGGFDLADRDINNNPVTIGTGTEDKVQLGEIFFAHVYELQAAPTTSNGLINGIALIQTSTQLGATHLKKIIHVAGGSNHVTITLDDIASVPENTIVVFETTINNNFQTKISGKVGQVIYFGATSNTEIYLGISEFLWLLRGSDGWYVLKASDGILNIGQPFMDYVQRLNTYPATGLEVSRADYPRLWNWVQANPDLVVTETLWQTTQELVSAAGDPAEYVYALRGKFSSGNGVTTFRFPDHQEMAYAALKAGSDADRIPNTPGTIQKDILRSHQHDVPTKAIIGATNPTYLSNYDTKDPATNVKTLKTGGSKTTPKNIGLNPYIRI